MKHIDELRLEEDAQYRYDYLTEFIDFGPDEVSLIQASAPHLGPRIEALVEETYGKLLGYDATARHFVPRQHGYSGSLPRDASELTSAHPQIQFRKDHLRRYFVQLIGRTFDSKMVQYLDMVGKIHTPHAGSAEIDVPLVQMNALLGVLSDVIMRSIAEWDLEPDIAARTMRAFNKLFWIQNDLISRHYRASGC